MLIFARRHGHLKLWIRKTIGNCEGRDEQLEANRAAFSPLDLQSRNFAWRLGAIVIGVQTLSVAMMLRGSKRAGT